MANNSLLVKAFSSMANFNSTQEKEELSKEIKHYNLDSWKNLNRTKTGSAGFATGVLGGPWAVAAEGADMAYLLRTCARASIGIGHILNADIDHEEDIYAILAIWSGAAEAANHAVQGKLLIKVGSKVGIKYGAATTAAILSKSTLKGGSKLATKIIALASSKMAAKLSTKIATKWIPVVGGAASAAVNLWVINGFMDAAHKYYTNEYLSVDEENV